MERRNVESSMIVSIGYDFSSSLLEIEFKGGALWQYRDFSESSWHQFDRAPSYGIFFHESIKGRYVETKVG